MEPPPPPSLSYAAIESPSLSPFAGCMTKRVAPCDGPGWAWAFYRRMPGSTQPPDTPMAFARDVDGYHVTLTAHDPNVRLWLAHRRGDRRLPCRRSWYVRASIRADLAPSRRFEKKVERICVCAWSLYREMASSRSRNQNTALRKIKSKKRAKNCLTFAPSASRPSSTPTLARTR